MSTDHAKLEKPKMDVYSGVRWSAFSKYGAQGMQFVISMVMARLLAPEYFGLMGMATVITGFVQVFKNLGFNSAIVQRKEVSEKLLSTLFWVNLGACILVGLVVLGVAPLASWMYEDPRVTPIVAVLSLNFVFAAFTMIPSAWLTRVMEFKKLALREIGGVIVAGLTAVPMAYYGWGVWALVGSSLASSAIQMILLNLAYPFRPRWTFDTKGLKECLKFGLNITGFNIFNYFARNADNLIIGIFLGPIVLGFYSLAYKLMLLPRDAMSRVVMRVMFPKLSKLQDEDEKLADVYLKATGAIAFLTFPVMLGLAALAEPFVLVVLGEKWLNAVPLIQILAPVGMIQSVSTTVGQVFLAKGKSGLMLRLGIIGGTVRILSFAIGVQWGAIGVAIAYAVTHLPLMLLNYYCIYRIVPILSISVVVRPMASPLFAAAACGVAAFSTSMIHEPNQAVFFLSIVVGAITYCAITLIAAPQSWHQLQRLAGVSVVNRAQTHI